MSTTSPIFDPATVKGMASLDELRDFCNRVRQAGGAKEIDDLMPAVPGQTEACLIAKALNFSCQVGALIDPDDYPKDPEAWAMQVRDEELAHKISKECKLPVIDKDEYYEVVLPKKIYRVAQIYDGVSSLMWECHTEELVESEDGERYVDILNEDLMTMQEKNLLKKFWPYFDDATKAAWAKPSFVD
jgi:hypothetical protein